MRFVFLSYISLFLDSYAALAQAACKSFPDAEHAAVTACETTDTYSFNVTGTPYSYLKATYQDRLRAMLGDWLAAADLTPPDDAVIEFWLAVPEANPSATQARAVLRSASLNLVWYLSLHPEDWTVADRDIGMLVNSSYPESFGHRPRQLLIKSIGANDALRQKLLQAHGATDPEPYASAWNIYKTAAGDELSVAASALRDPLLKPLVERIEVNHIVEWIAMRGLAFTFAFSKPSP